MAAFLEWKSNQRSFPVHNQLLTCDFVYIRGRIRRHFTFLFGHLCIPLAQPFQQAIHEFASCLLVGRTFVDQTEQRFINCLFAGDLPLES